MFEGVPLEEKFGRDGENIVVQGASPLGGD